MNRNTPYDVVAIEPARPRFLHEAVLVPFENDLLVDGTPQLRAFTGSAVKLVLQRLIPLMDGSRKLEELEAELPDIPAIQIRAAVSLLLKEGLLEDGAKDSMLETANPEALAFFRRFLSATQWNQSAIEVCRRLDTWEISVLASVRHQHDADTLRFLLMDAGIRNVSLWSECSMAAQAIPREQGPEHSLMIVLSFGDEDRDLFVKCQEWCFHNQIDWIRAELDEEANYADLGPLFRAATGPCYACFSSVHARSRMQNTQFRPSTDSRRAFWTGLVATEIIYFVTRLGPLLIGKGFRRYDPYSWASRDLISPRVPGCPQCRPALPSVGGVQSGRHAFIHTAVVFEDYTGLPSRSLVDPAANQERSRLGLMLTRQSKRYSVCQRIDLPCEAGKFTSSDVNSLVSNSERPQTACTGHDLAILLRLTAGFREGPAQGERQRWAATAGNLGSVELYVAAKSVVGLQPGLYFYQPHDHSLALLRWRSRSVELEEFITRVFPSSPCPDVLVLFTGAFHRLRKKYESFGYRLVNFDAGVAVSQMRLVASRLQLYSRAATLWPDDLIESQLRLDVPHEQVTAVVALSGQPFASTRALKEAGRSTELEPGRNAFARPLPDFYERTLPDVLAMLYQESRTSEEQFLLHTLDCSSQTRPQKAPQGGLAGLAATSGTLTSVDEILARRRSVRRFADRSIPLERLHEMLQYACRDEARDWTNVSGLELNFRLMASNVDGLREGIYDYQATSRELSYCMSLPSGSRRISELFIQPELASAPIHIWVTANPEMACALHGAWGHRQLLLRAGAITNRLWMAALNLGLSGTIVAGLVQGAVPLCLDLDNYRRAPLLVLPIGFANQHHV